MTRRVMLGCAVALASLLSASCSETPSPTQGVSSSPQALRTVVIDSTRMALVSGSAEHERGIYRFRVAGAPQPLAVGDVIVGAQGDGFLRRVVRVTEANGEVVLSTGPADLGDALGPVSFQRTITVPMDGPAPPALNGARYSLGPATTQFLADGISLDGAQLNFNNAVLFDASACLSAGLSTQDCAQFKLGIESGQVSFSPTLDLGASISLLGLTEAHMRVDGTATLRADAFVEVSGSVRNMVLSRPLLRQSRRFVTFVGVVPITGTVTTELVAEGVVAVSAKSRLNAGINSTATASVGAQWTKARGFERTTRFTRSAQALPVRVTAYPSATLRVSIKPRVTVSVLGLPGDSWAALGPYMSFTLGVDAARGVAPYTLGWGLGADAGVNFRVFNKTLGTFSYTLHLYDAVLKTGEFQLPLVPSSLVAVSGSNQRAAPGALLPGPLVVRAVDTRSRPVSGAKVSYSVASGGGKLSAASATTDAAGQAQVRWTLGSATGTQTVTASLQGLSTGGTRFTATAARP